MSVIVMPRNRVTDSPADRRRRRIGVLLASTAVLTMLVGCAAHPTASGSGAKQPITLTFARGSVPGGVARIPVHLGSTVDLLVHSDVTDEVHLHGYNRLVNITAGQPTKLEFLANIPGVFDVELEQRGIQLAQLEIS
jgi:hypothetical protein